MQSHTHSIFADFYQFYVEQCANDAFDLPDWPAGAVEHVRAAANGDAIAVRTESSKVVPVSVEVSNTPPANDLNDWDHVVECSLEIRAGCISLTSPSVLADDAEQIELPAGHYRARIYFGGLGSSATETESAEYYRIVLWQAAEPTIDGVVVLKAARGV